MTDVPFDSEKKKARNRKHAQSSRARRRVLRIALREAIIRHNGLSHVPPKGDTCLPYTKKNGNRRFKQPMSKDKRREANKTHARNSRRRAKLYDSQLAEVAEKVVPADELQAIRECAHNLCVYGRAQQIEPASMMQVCPNEGSLPWWKTCDDRALLLVESDNDLELCFNAAPRARAD